MKSIKMIRSIIPIVTILLILCYPLLQAQNSTTVRANGESEVVVITATDYAFEAPDEIESGWRNIRFSNEGEDPHLILFSRLPEGKTVDDYLTEAGPPFNKAWYQLRDGKITPQEITGILGKTVPEWFWGVERMGGAGLVMRGGVAETTINLPPGNYAMECYIKTEDGEIHFMEGMARPIRVLDKNSGGTAPKADLLIKVSNTELEVHGDLTAGKRVVEVQITEKPDKGLGHDVHVARLGAGANLQEVVQWMNWYSPNGMREPTPDHATFIGGMHFLPLNSPGYFTIDLSPGRYLFVSGAAADKGIFQEIRVK
ncbi:hypothetical protein LB467_01680 [Salegentibacter sp. JZCK2]|uniref:hypothetical protein n=1 Tax=Salegentibacter tibetensis TaxID=2873600 RepID=UPI001CCE0413|nr:hypothetical protein [Salegentibacter tibetensis]MBZ9728384.1 hypothetical protein [Salegentibacter tibetensis]